MFNIRAIKAEILSDSNPSKAFVLCPNCGQTLRVPLDKNPFISIKCPTCKATTSFNCYRYSNRRRLIRRSALIVSGILFLLIVGLPFPLIKRARNIDAIVVRDHDIAVQRLKSDFDAEQSDLHQKNEQEVKAIDSAKLRREAEKHYAAILKARSGFNSNFAITPREKAQLEMQSLANNRAMGVETIIKEIAAKAAPNNSTINVRTSGDSYSLDIEFDMSELVEGEAGTRTKHHTVDSLRKDVLRLISKVTNDVYQFCRDMELTSISIGCRHFVQEEQGDVNAGAGRELVNLTLYKIRINRKDLSVLKDNPFLNTYSTTQHFQVIVDGFEGLRIKTVKS